MQRREGLARISDRLVLVLCVGLSLWMMSWNEETRVRRATAWAHRVATPIERTIHFLEDLRSLRAENAELRAQIAALRIDAAYVEARRNRIEELEQRAGFYQRNRGRLRPATVLELEVGRIPIQAKIQTEDVDSLEILTPVVSERGLVGRISQVLGDGIALVQLLTHDESRISVRVARTGVTGLLRYDGRDFYVDYVPRGEPVVVGDRVFSSGLGGTVPEGIEVGTVAEVQSSPSELFLQVKLEPTVHFSAVDRVYVVTRPGLWYSRPGEFLDAAPDSTAEGVAGEEGS